MIRSPLATFGKMRSSPRPSAPAARRCRAPSFSISDDAALGDARAVELAVVMEVERERPVERPSVRRCSRTSRRRSGGRRSATRRRPARAGRARPSAPPAAAAARRRWRRQRGRSSRAAAGASSAAAGRDRPRRRRRGRRGGAARNAGASGIAGARGARGARSPAAACIARHRCSRVEAGGAVGKVEAPAADEALVEALRAHGVAIRVERCEPAPQRLGVVGTEADAAFECEAGPVASATKRDGEASMPPGKMYCWMKSDCVR